MGSNPDVRRTTAARITIVTPSYNSGAYLEETIRSVLLQSYPDLEYIIIDGGSTDDSLEIIHRYEKWIAHWRSEPDRGYADAVNKGFSKATGQILAWLPASDLYEPGALWVADSYLGNRRFEAIFGRTRFIDEDGRDLGVGPLLSTSLRAVSLYGRMNPCQPSTFWRRELHGRTGELNAALRYAADSEWFLRLSILGRCRGVPEIVCSLRQHAGQLSADVDRMREEWFTSWDTVVREHNISRLQLILGALLHAPGIRYRRDGWKGLFRLPNMHVLAKTLLRRPAGQPEASAAGSRRR